MFKIGKSIKSVIKTEYIIYTVSLLIFIIISNFVSTIKEEKELGFFKIQKTENLVCSLKKNENKLKFISKHIFNGKNTDYQLFIKNIAEKNKGTLITIDENEVINISDIKKQKISIKGTFWHDKHIFDFVNDLKDFHPGFISVLSIDIDKFSKISLSKPAIKMELTCEIFQK